MCFFLKQTMKKQLQHCYLVQPLQIQDYLNINYFTVIVIAFACTTSLPTRQLLKSAQQHRASRFEVICSPCGAHFVIVGQGRQGVKS